MLSCGSKVNIINPNYAWKLEFKIQKINVEIREIDVSALETFEIVITDFQVEDKVGRPRYFRETFLVIDTKFEVILGMLFLKITNTNILFGKKILMWKTYTINETLLTIKQVQIVNSKDCIIAVLVTDSKMFVVHVAIKEW